MARRIPHDTRCRLPEREGCPRFPSSLPVRVASGGEWREWREGREGRFGKTLPVGLGLSKSMDRLVRTHVLQWRQSRKRREAHAWHCKARISSLATRMNRRAFPMRHAHPEGRVRAGCRTSPPCLMRRARLGCRVRFASSKRRGCWVRRLLPRLSPWAMIWPTLL